jgi:nicotinamidase/pyrazinamidase
MEIVDKVRIIGRGNIVIVDNIKEYPLHINDKVRVRDLQFEITGIEFAEHMIHGGLILRPNDKVEEIKINDKIEKVMKKALLVIDVQKDFLDGGKLGVNGSIKVLNDLPEFIEKHGKEYDVAVATVDWHPVSHCSFKKNGGIWPAHCIQHSEGAAIFEPVLDALNNHTKFFTILTKGTDDSREEYSIFKNLLSSSTLVRMLNTSEIQEIDVVGIAYDYCVADSVKDGLRALPNVKFNVIKKFCPAIAEDSAKEFTNFIENTERVCLVEE